jgi:hypothetical protein
MPGIACSQAHSQPEGVPASRPCPSAECHSCMYYMYIHVPWLTHPGVHMPTHGRHRTGTSSTKVNTPTFCVNTHPADRRAAPNPIVTLPVAAQTMFQVLQGSAERLCTYPAFTRQRSWAVLWAEHSCRGSAMG